MHFITKFGDLSVLMPLSLLLSVSLWRCETKEAARGFIKALMLCLSVMLLSKLFFLSCGNNFLISISSPSGHTAASTFVFGSIGLVLSTHAPQSARTPILIAALLFIVTIAVSRLSTGAHSVAEVAIALMVGAIALFYFARNYSRLDHPRFNVWLLALAIAFVAVVLHGAQLPAEGLIRKASLLIRTQTAICTALEIAPSNDASNIHDSVSH